MSELRRRRAVDGRLAARLFVFVGALFGLFAVHGLGDHGVGRPSGRRDRDPPWLFELSVLRT